MSPGGKASIIAAAALIGGCADNGARLKPRVIADPVSKIIGNGDAILAARGQLALGNVGLALEAFRKTQRERPNDPAPLAGIGDCYVAMSRLDLAQTSYEAALALAPRDRKLLLGLAFILEGQGNRIRAAETRAEADRDKQPIVGVGSLTVDLPPARPMAQTEPTLPVAMAAAAPPALSSTVTVALPPARPVMPLPSVHEPQAVVIEVAGPRLERLSFGEVALITTAEPVRAVHVRMAAAEPLKVRWIPLSGAASAPNVQILNAARRNGLAASARASLLALKWRNIAISDAHAISKTSVVLYPKGRARLARSLAAEFRVPTRAGSNPYLVLVLGQDALDRPRSKRRA